MTKRIALKLLNYPVIPGHRALTAARRVLRYVGNDPRPACGDCPIGGRDGRAKAAIEDPPGSGYVRLRQPAPDLCPRIRSCDRQCVAQTIALAVDNGQHPFGPWKCLMQRAMDGEHVVTFDGPFAAIHEDK